MTPNSHVTPRKRQTQAPLPKASCLPRKSPAQAEARAIAYKAALDVLG